jgi:hypothetical protein
MPRQHWSEPYAWTTSDSTAVANTTTESVLFPNVTVYGNHMQDGRIAKVTCFFKHSTTGTPTLTFAARWNGVSGTLLATTEPITCGSGVTNLNGMLQLYIQTRANGSSGTLFAWGVCHLHTSSTAVSTNIFSVSGYDAPAAVSSLDLSTDTPLSITVDWSAASASNTITGMHYVLEYLN